MGIYIGPLEHYLGFGRRDVYEKWEGESELKPNGIIYETECALLCLPNPITIAPSVYACE